jgi:hypothetical protein
LGTGGGLFTAERRDQLHVRTQMRDHRHTPSLPAPAFAFGRQIAHVGDDLTRPPRPALIAVTHAGHQQSAFGNVGRRHPTDQWHQQDRVPVGTPPQAEAVLFVANEPAALAGLERAPTQGRVRRGVSAGVFFLKPLQAASKSVASISATDVSQPAARSTKGWRRWSLIARKPETPTRSRNWWSTATWGTPWRRASRAKARHAGWSGSMASNRLKKRAGVSRASKWTRHSWAALKVGRGPRAGRTFQCSLIKASGMCGSKQAKSSLVPVTGSGVFMPKDTTGLCATCPLQVAVRDFQPQPSSFQSLTE